MVERAKESWLRFRESRDPASLRMVIALATVATALAIYLMAGPNPWENAIVKRIAAGKPLKLDHLIPMGLWWGAVVGLLASLTALATVKWWSRPQSAVYPDLHPPAPRTRRWLWIFACLAILPAIWPRMARLDHSLWNDEEMQFRYYVLGAYSPTPDGSLEFDPVTLEEAVFFNRKGNNHIWSALEARAGHLLGGHDWSPGNGFSERHLRLAPFLSGLLTVATLVLLGGAMGSPRLGLAAGLILALHPWHVRWSVEVRGYSTMLLAVSAGLLCLVRALQTNRWRWWLGFAAAQALFLLCFAGSLYIAAAQNAVALICILRSGAAGPVRLSSAARLGVAGVFSLIPVALIMGPSVPQIAAYLKVPHTYSPIGPDWLIDLWAHLVAGLRRTGDAPGLSAGLGVNDLIASAPWRGWIIFGVMPMLVVIGLISMFRQDFRTRLVAGTLLLAAAFALAHNALSQNAFVTWYLLYLVLLFALAVAWAGKALSALHRKVPASLPLLLAVLFMVTTSPALYTIVSVPRQPIREAVAAMRGVAPALDPKAPAILTASFGDGARQMLSYDPHLHVLEDPEELARLITEATNTQRPLFLGFRDRIGMQQECPQLLAAVTGDPRWERLADLKGMEAMWSYEIYRFAPERVGRIGLKPRP